MKILHNQSQLKKVLILGILYVIIGILSIITTYKGYLAGFIGIGVLYIVQYCYKKNRAYVLLNENAIICNGIVKKEIATKDILSVKYFAGDYTIKSAEKEIRIDTNLIDKASLSHLKEYFEKLNVKG